MSVATLSTLIPSSPGYVGTFHYSLAKSLQLFGMSNEESHTYALLIHTIFWTIITIFGLISFLNLFFNKNKYK